MFGQRTGACVEENRKEGYGLPHCLPSFALATINRTMRALFTRVASRVPRESKPILRRWSLTVTGVLWGGLLALPLLCVTVFEPGSRVSNRVFAWERSRQKKRFGLSINATEAPRRFLLFSAGVALAAFTLVAYMLITSALMLLNAVVQLFAGGYAVISFLLWTVNQPAVQVGLFYGIANAVGAIAFSEAARWLHQKIDEAYFDVSRPRSTEARISELLTTRRGVVLAIDEERRRIERDLHDGVQQNAVSLSVLLARARRAEDPERAAELLDDAFAQSRHLIEEISKVAWRTYPAALDEHGLKTALDQVVQHSPVPLTVLAVPESRPPQPVETAAYFLVREAVTNVVKHAEAASITVAITSDPGPDGQPVLRVKVRDDGRGGALPDGGGLQGLARRVAALDGRMTVVSPSGGGTEIKAEIPYD